MIIFKYKTPELTIKKRARGQNIPSRHSLVLLKMLAWACSRSEKNSQNARFSQKKVDTFRLEDLEDEASDVLITLLLVLKSIGVTSLDQAL
ncbi:hypothetical protein H6769_04810 [Candidatus Peribacteria bacterium]|nr:hypothetical protein [Candidatus Peribacteria bacterium]